MDDLISRQAAIDAVMKLRNAEVEHYGKAPCKGYWELTAAREMIKMLPSAQPEIIRCKDCKWWSNDDYRECSSPNYDDGYVTPAGFYCGYAERRTDGSDR